MTDGSTSLADWRILIYPSKHKEQGQPLYNVNIQSLRNNEMKLCGLLMLNRDELSRWRRIFEAHEAKPEVAYGSIPQ